MFKKLLLAFSITISLQYVQSQEWHAELQSESSNFYELQAAFDRYWIDKPHERGTGYNVYKRWEWFWEQRVNPDGSFPLPGHDVREAQKLSRMQQRRTDFKGIWQPMGPTTTPSGYNGLGRINCMAFHPTDPQTFWVGSPSGGVWKTTNYGKTWSTSTDKNAVLGVSSILVHPVNPDTIYIATGDGDRGSLWGMTGTAQGDNKSIGVLRSVDGGNTWHQTGLNWEQSETKLIRHMIMHPQLPHIILAAASDGVYKTIDAGQTWRRVAVGYFKDIAFKPDNPNIVYAATFVSSGAGNARFFRSTNGGENFSITYTVPNGGRIAMAVSPLMPEIVHLLVAHRSGGRFEGVYESVDSGNSFVQICNSPNILANTYNGSGTSGQGWYDLTYSFSPVDINVTYVGGVNSWRSTNRGRNFSLLTIWADGTVVNPTNVPVVHADKHYFTHHPLETETFFDCNDGGVYYTKNRGATWVDISEGLNITQFYRFAIHPSDTQIVLGGTQDNGARIRRSDATWGEATGGDGMECGIDPLNPDYMYTTYAYGRLYRSINGFETRNTTTISNNIPGRPAGAWVTPYKLDPKNSGRIIAGYRDVYRTTNYGNAWTRISFSLANNNLLRNIAIAPNNTNILYAGDYNAIYRTWNDGVDWERIYSSATPISMIRVHPDNDSIVYFTHSSYNTSLKVLKFDATEAGNGSITNLTFDLPNISVNCLEFHPGRNNALYIGTDIGVFYRDDLSETWVPFMQDLPNVVVTELKANYQANILYAATFGRGIWKSSLYLSDDPLKVTNFSPEHNATDVALNSNLIIHFSDLIKKGNGNIKLYYTNNTNDGLFEELSVHDSSVSFEGNKIIINRNKLFMGNQQVRVSLDYDAVRTMFDAAFEGFTDTLWNFSTAKGSSNTLQKSDVLLYPNPATTALSVQCVTCDEPFELELFDMNGRNILSEESISISRELDVRTIEAGAYIVYIRYKGGKLGKMVLINVAP